ncbi:hypothetical protein SAMN06265367_106247 [Algoriphagus winogradskyi]|uniref:Uncharacterized protein n=1 Tax=Algoriphagus winogradskyi TaxID=237017 RepID=A0ABY1PAD1_9BACT|nr:hypothetical protein SAMN06265367_106247 [Algoriphagus winogradskyi]
MAEPFLKENQGKYLARKSIMIFQNYIAPNEL